MTREELTALSVAISRCYMLAFIACILIVGLCVFVIGLWRYQAERIRKLETDIKLTKKEKLEALDHIGLASEVEDQGKRLILIETKVEQVAWMFGSEPIEGDDPADDWKKGK